MKVLLITPPLTQLNTPYPATTVLKGYLQTHGHPTEQMDLGIELVNRIYTRNGLTKIFDFSAPLKKNDGQSFMYEARADYENCVETVIRFLQGKDQTIASRIASHNLLPEGPRFANMCDTEWAFGAAGTTDTAKYLATLFIEDIADYIRETVDSHFDLVRYAEHLGTYAPTFDTIEKALEQSYTLTDQWMTELLEDKINQCTPQAIGFSVPFPGCLYAALRCGQHIKKNHPEIHVTMGGGYPNTELRQISDSRIFRFIDTITLDDGELPLTQVCNYLEGKAKKDELIRTYYIENGKIAYSGNDNKNIRNCEIGTPDFDGLKMDQYLSMAEVSNPMQTLWSSGKWNKMVMAHGCYWAKCAFCDVTLDYIKRYDAPSAQIVVDRMESIMKQTGESGFHFTDEAMPPRLLHEVANEIKKRQIATSYWGNIRFDKSYNKELCESLADSGCVAVSGGLEVASNRVLELMHKGVTIEQTTMAMKHLTDAGIMVHAYLMYGFPTESLQECIDALEVVRQLFEEGLVQSAFWHRYAMTLHSPSGQHPENYGVKRVRLNTNPFSNNEVEYEEELDYDSDKIGAGLSLATYNYMNGTGIDLPLHKWFKTKVPNTNIGKNLIRKIAKQAD